MSGNSDICTGIYPYRPVRHAFDVASLPSPAARVCSRSQVGDFGLSRALDSGRSHLQRTAGCVAGSLSHLAPEALLRGEMRREGDVYAFGVLRE